MANLRTDYVDDELDVSVNENRRYHMIDNGDGTVSFEDVTEYLQQGDNYGSAEVNEQNETINQINVDLSEKTTQINSLNSTLSTKADTSYVNTQLATKQNAATAITTSNIGNQSVDSAQKWNGLINDISTANTTDTWLLVLGQNNKVQHKVLPAMWEKAAAQAQYTQCRSVNFGYDSNKGLFRIDLNFADNTCASLSFNNQYIAFDYKNSSGTWNRNWQK